MSAAPGADHGQRVAGFADALVGGDRHVDPPAQLGQFLDGRAGLLEVLQRAQCGGGCGGLVDGPGAVGVDAHGGHQGADRIDPGHVVVEGLARLGDLHLGGTCAREAGQYFGHLRGVDRRHRGVDVDAIRRAGGGVR